MFTLHVRVLNGVHGGYWTGSMVEMMECYDSVRWIASMLFVDINIFTWSRLPDRSICGQGTCFSRQNTYARGLDHILPSNMELQNTSTTFRMYLQYSVQLKECPLRHRCRQ